MATRLHPLASAVTVDLSHGRIELKTPSVDRAVAVPTAWLVRAVAALGIRVVQVRARRQRQRHIASSR